MYNVNLSIYGVNRQVWVKEFDNLLNVDYTMNSNILSIYALEKFERQSGIL